MADEVRRMFDVPVKVRLRGRSDPLNATLLHIAISGCRLRAPFDVQRGTALSFEWRLSNGTLLNVPGVVAAQYPSRDGHPGFEYALALEALPEADSDALASEAALLARSASARNFDTSLVDISQFMNYRVPDDVRVSYRRDNPRTFGIGSACDITGNALRLHCTDVLSANETIHLAVQLPDDVLSVHKGDDEELVTAPMSSERVPRKVLKRPFQEIQVSGCVEGVVKDSRRRDAYEVKLLGLNGLARQEIARYIHAAQLSRFKR
ncbi:MAG TPA: PilZ domain-containing protein [Candidatus Baltobacteraceae bacterium]|nr:PilZ domain-containing protein [Candidatus Baltobacteraceae bacterium]